MLRADERSSSWVRSARAGGPLSGRDRVDQIEVGSSSIIQRHNGNLSSSTAGYIGASAQLIGESVGLADPGECGWFQGSAIGVRTNLRRRVGPVDGFRGIEVVE